MVLVHFNKEYAAKPPTKWFTFSKRISFYTKRTLKLKAPFLIDSFA